MISDDDDDAAFLFHSFAKQENLTYETRNCIEAQRRLHARDKATSSSTLVFSGVAAFLDEDTDFLRRSAVGVVASCSYCDPSSSLSASSLFLPSNTTSSANFTALAPRLDEKLNGLHSAIADKEERIVTSVALLDDSSPSLSLEAAVKAWKSSDKLSQPSLPQDELGFSSFAKE
jgi:hypothetical protein